MFPPASGAASAAAWVIVAGGGRDLAWPLNQVRSALLQPIAARPVLQLLHGAARGADQLIASAADQLGWPVTAIAADWQRHGRRAGPIRNRQLLDRAQQLAAAFSTPRQPVAVLVITFPGGAGTASLLQQAQRRSLFTSCQP